MFVSAVDGFYVITVVSHDAVASKQLTVDNKILLLVYDHQHSHGKQSFL